MIWNLGDRSAGENVLLGRVNSSILMVIVPFPLSMSYIPTIFSQSLQISLLLQLLNKHGLTLWFTFRFVIIWMSFLVQIKFPSSSLCNNERHLLFIYFIGSESNHWLSLLVTYCCSVDLIAMTLACDNATSKLVAVVRSADVNAEKRVDKSLVQIRKLKFCQFWPDFEHKV